MVNTCLKASSRSRILEILRNSATAVSGERIAESLGISRVGVWKAIKGLNESGYAIQATASGYTLAHDDADRLFPWEFGSDELRVRHWAETDSTMNRARDAALSGCEDRTLIIADSQTNGRGTGIKRWESVPGGLFFTLVTRQALNAAYAHRQVLAAQCALVRAIRSVSGITVFPGWPNDILVNDGKTSGKVCGILGETLSSGNSVEYINLGIGVNTGSAALPSGSAAIDSGRKEIISAFLREFDTNDYMRESLVSEWNSLCPDMDRPIRFIPSATPFSAAASGQAMPESGIFRGVDRFGHARIETPQSDNGANATITGYPPLAISLLNKGRKP